MNAQPEAFPLEGGWLGLAFCNTVGWHSGAYRRAELYSEGHDWERSTEAPGSHERFTEYRALVGWFLRKRQIGVGEAKRLLRAARARPEEAEAVRRRAISLRETLYHVFSALADERDPDPRDVAALNGLLPEAMARRRLTYVGQIGETDDFEGEEGEGGPGRDLASARGPGAYGAADTGAQFVWEPVAEADDLQTLLWPVVWSAVELLTGGPVERVRECDNDPCGWLFVDMSRNRSRRWCDMRDCGNRVKARRHYARTKQAAQG